MKKLLFLLMALLVIPVMIFSQETGFNPENLGVSLSIGTSSEKYEVTNLGTTSDTTDKYTRIGASVFYFLNENSDVSVGIASESWKEKDDDSIDGSILDDYSRKGWVFSVSYNKTFIQKEYIGVGLGGYLLYGTRSTPSGDSITGVDNMTFKYVELGLPLSFEIYFSENIMTRFSTPIYSIYYSHSEYADETDYSESNKFMGIDTNFFDISENVISLDLIYKF